MNTEQGFQQDLECPENQTEFLELVRIRTEERKARTDERRLKGLECLNNVLRIQNEVKPQLDVLPDLAMIEILLQIKDPKDLANTWDVHPTLRDLSGESQSHECLLTKVLGIEKLPHLWMDNGTRIRRLNLLRALSKGMRSTVDQTFEDDFMRKLRAPVCHMNPDSLVGCRIWIESYEDSNETLDGILANLPVEFGESRATFTFHRSLSVSMQPIDYEDIEPIHVLLERYAQNKDKMTSLLAAIGHQLWHFELVIRGYLRDLQRMGLSVQDLYQLLQQWALLMPNLKWIQVHIGCSDPDRPDDHGDKVDLQAFFQSVNNFPFPHLPHLERIRVSACSTDMEMATTAAIIRPNLQIRSFDSPRTFFGKGMVQNNMFFMTELKPILSKLNLKMINGLGAWTQPNTEILKPVFSAWKLTTLTHRFVSYGDSQPSLDLSAIIQFVNAIPSLRKLSLQRVPAVIIGAGIPPLKLPNLEHFQLGFFIHSIDHAEVEKAIFFTSLQFLFPSSKNLKTIVMWWMPDRSFCVNSFKGFLVDNEANEMIQYKCGFHDFEQSNIWDVFTELEYLECSMHRPNGSRWKHVEYQRTKLMMIK